MLGLTITAPVGSVGSVYHAVSDCRRLSEEFTADGSVVLRVTAEVGQVRELQQREYAYRWIAASTKVCGR